jgi:hypothetical protein
MAGVTYVKRGVMQTHDANLTVIAGGAFLLRKNSINRVGVKNARRSAGFE